MLRHAPRETSISWGRYDLDEMALREFLGDLLRLKVEDDGIRFEIGSIAVRPIRPGSTVLGLRAKFNAHLGRTRLRYQVDVGLGDAVFPPPVELIPGGLLNFPMASVLAYTPYTTVAEKLESIVILGDANSRIKDYYDLYQLPRALDFHGPTLVRAIRHTFACRATTIPAKPLAFGPCSILAGFSFPNNTPAFPWHPRNFLP